MISTTRWQHARCPAILAVHEETGTCHLAHVAPFGGTLVERLRDAEREATEGVAILIKLALSHSRHARDLPKK